MTQSQPAERTRSPSMEKLAISINMLIGAVAVVVALVAWRFPNIPVQPARGPLSPERGPLNTTTHSILRTLPWHPAVSKSTHFSNLPLPESIEGRKTLIQAADQFKSDINTQPAAELFEKALQELSPAERREIDFDALGRARAALARAERNHESAAIYEAQGEYQAAFHSLLS